MLTLIDLLFFFFLSFTIHHVISYGKNCSINISLVNIYRRFYTNLVSFVLLLCQGFTWLMISMCKSELLLKCWGSLVCSFCHVICSLGERRQREACLWGFELTKWTVMMSMTMIPKRDYLSYNNSISTTIFSKYVRK